MMHLWGQSRKQGKKKGQEKGKELSARALHLTLLGWTAAVGAGSWSWLLTPVVGTLQLAVPAWKGAVL